MISALKGKSGMGDEYEAIGPSPGGGRHLIEINKWLNGIRWKRLERELEQGRVRWMVEAEGKGEREGNGTTAKCPGMKLH